MDTKDALVQFLEAFAADVRAETLAEAQAKLAMTGRSGKPALPRSASYVTALAAIKGGTRKVARLGPKLKRAAVAPKTETTAAQEGSKRRDRAELERLTKGALQFIMDNPGKGSGAAAKHLGVGSRDLVFPIKKLKSENLIKQKGNRGAAVYFPK